MPQIVHREPTRHWTGYVWSTDTSEGDPQYYWSLSYHGDLHAISDGKACGDPPNLIPDSGFYDSPDAAIQALEQEIGKHTGSHRIIK